MRVFCFTHNRLTLGYRLYQKDEIIKFNCGCEIEFAEVSKHRVIQVNTYYLIDGREIVKDIRNVEYRIIKHNSQSCAGGDKNGKFATTD